MATTLDSAQRRLEEAQATARKRATRETIGPDWPPADAPVEEAATELTLWMLLYGARLGLGNTAGSADIWCRVAIPLDADHEYAGKVGFVTSNTVAKALAKASRLLEPGSKGLWKPDAFAK